MFEALIKQPDNYVASSLASQLFLYHVSDKLNGLLDDVLEDMLAILDAEGSSS